MSQEMWISCMISFFLGIIFANWILNMTSKKNKHKEIQCSGWDANKAREESEIGRNRKIEKEINDIYERIKISSNNGEYHIYKFTINKIDEIVEKFFKDKGYKIEELSTFDITTNDITTNYKISWEDKK